MREAGLRQLALLLFHLSTSLCFTAVQQEHDNLPFFVYVYATHKTGSTFLSGLAANSARLKHVCMLSDTTNVETLVTEVLPATAEALKAQCPFGGFIMTRGPRNHPGGEEAKIAERLASASAPHRCLSIFHSRDPRDVAVSQFNAFTTSNAHISSKKNRTAIMAEREKQHALGIDDYALRNWPGIMERYEAPFAAQAIHSKYCDTFFSEYTDMVQHPEKWGGRSYFLTCFLITRVGVFVFLKISLESVVTPSSSDDSIMIITTPPNSHVREAPWSGE